MIGKGTPRILVGLIAVFTLGFVSLSSVKAQAPTLSDEMIDTIRARCSNSQFALQQIEKRDAVSRINRGRAYDQMLRQLSAFNSRFAYNKINSPELIQITTELQKAVDDFRTSYDRYDTDIANALKINCKERPADYYAIILKAREDRRTVGSYVDKISQLIDQYRGVVLKYGETIE